MKENPKIPLSFDIETRDGTLTKDAKMGNVLLNQNSKGVWAQKRPGLSVYQTQTAGAFCGFFYAFSNAYVILQVGTANCVAYLLDGTTQVGITIPYSNFSSNRFFDTGYVNATYAYISSSSGLYQFNGTTFTQVAGFIGGASANSPVIVLDGTFYALQLTGSTIYLYASNYGDPTTWNSLNYILPDPSLGSPITLARVGPYIIVFLSLGTQFFYDAGISPGAPLAQVSNGAVAIGCAHRHSLAVFEGAVYFMSIDADGRQAFGVFNSLQYTKISTEAIDKVLGLLNLAPNYTAVDMFATITKVNGHILYMVSINTANITLVYDITSGVWDYWSSVIAGVEGLFNGVGGVAVNGFNPTIPNQSSLYCGLTDGNIYTLNPSVYQDNGQPIRAFIRTPPWDFDTYELKFCSAAYLHSDTISTTVSVTYSNDDYQTFAVSRTIDMSTQKKQLIRVGSFRHRSWDLLHTDNTPFRVRLLELDLTDTGEDAQ